MTDFPTLPLPTDARMPLIVDAPSPGHDLAGFTRLHREAIESRVLAHGAVLLRGFAVADVAAFDRFVGALTDDRLDYLYSSTPRTALGDRIFTATEYPAALEIPLHNECAYQRDWPMKISLCCLQPAASGGETPLADMRRVSARLGEALLDRFEARGVRYVRHYHPLMDVPWQKSFQTDERAEVERICAERGIECDWLAGDVLRTSQVCQGTVRHPATGERFLFNQAHLFHVSALGGAAPAMLRQFGADRLPRHAFFGDGSEIRAADLDAVRQAFKAEAIAFPWQAGDVVLADNLQVAHGRRPFRGQRKVVVALMEGRTTPPEALRFVAEPATA